MQQQIEGQTIARRIEAAIRQERETLLQSPILDIIQIGNDPISEKYVSLKQRKGAILGISVRYHRLQSQKNTFSQARTLIKEIQNDTNGILFQLPIEPKADTERYLRLIPRRLDVDGLLLEESPFPTAVAAAVLTIIKELPIQRETRILVLGESPYVGKSIFRELKKHGFTNIESINEFSENPQEKIKNAAVLISCVGIPGIFSEQDVTQGAMLIDVGTSLTKEGKVVGDFRLTPEAPRFAFYTPVPGGVGPITVACLLQQVTRRAKQMSHS
ncbi:MAG: bifunctional 5,10-methylenetetrahydrofolate dehydrogenase/5,10-methenyltetrahydrofolate cyclohydrolase [Candidatus Dojkabacteria bacterium]|nr:MAG: bifunctional 5,10-methylenetetrahydrofolate dehydrogenase/5,10-methenyltetrahydrofolate cyclohydrolase [Candidatus Dojkabacteria bacterium]